MNLETITVRPATTDDAYSAQILRKHAWQARYVSPETGVTKELIETEIAPLPPSKTDLDYYAKLLSKPANKGRNLVALLNGDVIGTVFYDELADSIGDIGVFVADDYNDKGVGGKLLDALIKATNNSLQVEIYARNPSRGFYKAHGFIEVGNETKHYFNDSAYLPVQVLRLIR